jgi:hypothetical protein
MQYESDPNKFDLIVDRWDAQGNRVGGRNTYRKYIQNGSEYYERPVNSGNLWFENNTPAGRVICEFNDKGHIVKKEFDFTAKHVAFIPAPTGAEKIAAQLASEQAANAALRAELDAIKKDKEPQKPVQNFAPQAAAKSAEKQAPPKLSKPE